MQKISGLFFTLAGFLVWMGITTAEILYPDYNVNFNFISTLAASPPPDSIIVQPSAAIFNISMFVAGGLIVAGVIVINSINKDRIFKIALLLMGIGCLGVGLFPAYTGLLHILIALVAFGAAGIAAILSSKDTSSPFKYLSIVLGATSLGFLIVGDFLPFLVVPTLGRGGTERWVAYPTMIWLITYGGYLMASKK